MQHTYTVRFARDDPETPPTMDEQIALARKARPEAGRPERRVQSEVGQDIIGASLEAPGTDRSGRRTAG